MDNTNEPTPAASTSAAQVLKPTRRRRGKVARLPRRIREQVNIMLDDGLPYAEIISRLGEHGKHLNKDNLTNWHRGGFLDWLKDQPWLDQLHASLDFASTVLDDSDSPKIREASLVIAVRQMYELIRTFEPAEFKSQLSADPAIYARILSSLARLAEVGLRYDHEHGEVTRSAARETTRSTKAAGLTDDMLRQYENEFKLLRRPRKTSPPEPPPAQENLSEVSASPASHISEPAQAQEMPGEVKRD